MRRLIILAVLAASCSGAKTDTATPGPVFEADYLDLPEAAPELTLARVEPTSQNAEPELVLTAMKKELERSMKILGQEADPPPYFIAYEARDMRGVTLRAEYGGLVQADDDSKRVLDVEVRVGDHRVDNTHKLSGGGGFMFSMPLAVPLPMENDERTIRAAIWLETDRQYKHAAETLIKVKADKRVKAEEEDKSDDFSNEDPSTFLEKPAVLTLDRAAWENRLREYSALFKVHSEIHSSSVTLQAEASTRYFVNSEGSTIQTARTHYRLFVHGETKADDGMTLTRYELLDAADGSGIDDDDRIRAKIALVIDDLLALREAPVGEPYTGPAIIEGKASAVFFHEIFGHRMEGHRQKEEDSSQTFARKIGERVMPSFINVHDDPTIVTVNGTDLNGHYRYDNEGVAGSKVTLIEDGVVKTFLMSRSPARGINASNGHGRKQEGFDVVARQGNLVVQPSHTTTPEELKKALIAEVERQGKEYGLRFRNIQGGFTFTQRFMPQAFKVLPTIVFRVYPDGREELVRGLDIEGTPLVALSDILAAANDYDVFNGTCGAESGGVPVSGVSPSLLVKQIEVARKEKSRVRPPLLDPPRPTTKGGSK